MNSFFEHNLYQGTYNAIGNTLFCFPKSKQIIRIKAGLDRK